MFTNKEWVGRGGNNVILIAHFTCMFINPLLGLRICLTFCYPLHPKLLIFCRNLEIIFNATSTSVIILWHTAVICFPGVPGFKPRPETECPEAFPSFHYFFSPQVAIRRPVSAKGRLQSKPNPRWICVVQSDTMTSLSRSTSVVPCQYQFIDWCLILIFLLSTVDVMPSYRQTASLHTTHTYFRQTRTDEWMLELGRTFNLASHNRVWYYFPKL